MTPLPPTPLSSPQAAATDRLSRAAVLSAKQTRRKRRALLHAELTGPQAYYYGEMVEDDYRSLECSWQGSWPALLHHRFTFLVKRSPSRLRSHWHCSQFLARLRMEVQREKKKKEKVLTKWRLSCRNGTRSFLEWGDSFRMEPQMQHHLKFYYFPHIFPIRYESQEPLCPRTVWSCLRHCWCHFGLRVAKLIAAFPVSRSLSQTQNFEVE